MTEDAFKLQTSSVRDRFERAAASYDSVAVAQREISRRMQERLDLLRIEPRVILDLGAGTGADLSGLRNRYRKSHVIALDLAHRMMQQARRRFRWRRPSLIEHFH